MPLRADWLILCSLLLASPAWSQRAGGPPGRYGGEKPAICSVSGTVTQAAEGGAIPFASVALMSMRDSSIVAGQLAGDDGAFSLTELPFGRYRLQVNFMGYAPYSLTHHVATDNDFLRRYHCPQPPHQRLEEAVVVEEASSLEMLIDGVFNVEMTSPPPEASPANCWSKFCGRGHRWQRIAAGLFAGANPHDGRPSGLTAPPKTRSSSRSRRAPLTGWRSSPIHPRNTIQMAWPASSTSSSRKQAAGLSRSGTRLAPGKPQRVPLPQLQKREVFSVQQRQRNHRDMFRAGNLS